MKPRREHPPSPVKTDPRLLAARDGWPTTLRYALLLGLAKPPAVVWSPLVASVIFWSSRW